MSVGQEPETSVLPAPGEDRSPTQVGLFWISVLLRLLVQILIFNLWLRCFIDLLVDSAVDSSQTSTLSTHAISTGKWPQQLFYVQLVVERHSSFYGDNLLKLETSDLKQAANHVAGVGARRRRRRRRREHTASPHTNHRINKPRRRQRRFARRNDPSWSHVFSFSFSLNESP